MPYIIIIAILLLLAIYLASDFQEFKKYSKDIFFLAVGLGLFFLLVKFVSPLISTVIGLTIALFPIISRFLTNIFPYIGIFLNIFTFPIFRNGSKNGKGNSKVTLDEAYDILSINKDATKKEIEEAFRSKISENHPDKGGSKYLAEKIIEARDLLLKHKKK